MTLSGSGWLYVGLVALLWLGLNVARRWGARLHPHKPYLKVDAYILTAAGVLVAAFPFAFPGVIQPSDTADKVQLIGLVLTGAGVFGYQLAEMI